MTHRLNLAGQMPLLSLIVLCAVTALLTDRFLSPLNLTNILVQSSIMAVIAMGMTFVIVGGGFDLSVGSTAALSGCIAAMVMLEAGIAVGVVSNIGWDLRPVFRAHGMDSLVDAYILSFEHGIQKPDARLFQAACDELGQDPHDVLMVGDSREADGGAAALGCEVFLVDHLPVEERPAGLRPVLGLAGLGALP